MKKTSVIICLSFIMIFLSSCTIDSSNDAMSYTGSVEGKEIVIKSQMNGEILEGVAREGEQVEKGQSLVKIDNELMQYDLKELEIAKDIAELTLSDLLDGVQETNIILKESEVNVINEEISAQQRLIQYNKEQFEKNNILFNSSAISKDQLSASELIYQQSIDRLEILYQKRSVAINAMENIRNSTTDQVIKKANKNIESIKNKINQLNYKIEKSNIQSPISGIIQNTYIDPGEFVTIGEPIIKIIDPSELHLIIYVPEKNLSKIELNQKVKFTDNFLEDEAYGRISFISEKAEFTPKNVSSKESKQTLVFKTKIQIQESSLAKPGMYLTVDLLGE